MTSFHLALPESLKRLKLPSLKQKKITLTAHYYSDFASFLNQLPPCPLVVVLSEEDYQSWFAQRKKDEEMPIGLILVPSSSNFKFPKNASNWILSWIDEGISQNHWEFTLIQALELFQGRESLKDLEETTEYQRFELNRLNEIGIALSAEKDIDSLLDLIVTKAMKLAHADAGSLYLIESIPEIQEDPDNYFADKRFRFQVAKNDSRRIPFSSFVLEISKQSIYGYVALTGKPLLIDDAYFIDDQCEFSWGGSDFDQSINYRTKSMLTVPMLNREDNVTGVIQLINCKRNPSQKLGEPQAILDQVISFSEAHAKATESIASQAAIALENAKLIESIQNLFDGFINASVTAIESRDPTTSGHSGRVATLTVALAEAVNRCDQGTLKKTLFSEAQIQEMRYASLLHDFGKIGVREEVLVKSQKLYPAEVQVVLDRFRMIRQLMELNAMRAQLQQFLKHPKDKAMEYLETSQRELENQLAELDDDLSFIMGCNEPTVVHEGDFQRLNDIGKKHIIGNVDALISYLNDHEIESLSVPKGSLNQQDRLEIESHVTHTYRFLRTIPWTKNLSQVPEIAYAHHEKLNGTGYPRQLTSDQIPLPSKMMTIADIYDALTAWDRPYKKAIPVERALTILEHEAANHQVDVDLLNVFIEAKLYELVMRPEE